MYDPTIGRWISEDPIGFEAEDPNLYRYVGNDPLNRRDPSGQLAQPAPPRQGPTLPRVDYPALENPAAPPLRSPGIRTPPNSAVARQIQELTRQV
jgi:hypothetical protein